MTSRNNLETQNNQTENKVVRRFRFIAPTVALVLTGMTVLLSVRHKQLYKVTILPPLGATFTRPVALNDRNQIVGLADVTGKSHLFLWDRDNGVQDLGLALRFGPDINNSGRIAGTTVDPNGNRQAFVWDPNSGKQMLGSLDNENEESIALAMNNRGQIVGFSGSIKDRPHAFIWDKTNGMRKLSQGWYKSSMALNINDSGQVIGSVGLDTKPSTPCFWDSNDYSHDPKTSFISPLPRGSDLNNNGYVLCLAIAWNKERWWASRWAREKGVEHLFPIEQPVGVLKFNDANQIIYGEKKTSSLERISKKYFGPYTQH